MVPISIRHGKWKEQNWRIAPTVTRFLLAAFHQLRSKRFHFSHSVCTTVSFLSVWTRAVIYLQAFRIIAKMLMIHYHRYANYLIFQKSLRMIFCMKFCLEVYKPKHQCNVLHETIWRDEMIILHKTSAVWNCVDEKTPWISG